MAKVLVVGGAGYVGSATCAWLLDANPSHEVWVLDDLSTGRRELVDRLPGIKGFVQARVGDSSAILPLMQRERFDCVMHFAARSIVAESVAKPSLYVENNVDQTRALLETMRQAGIRRFIFSSSCAIFGSPGVDVEKMNEDLPKRPLHPYGATKLEVELMLEKEARENGLQAIALRYFNAAGAEPKGRVGEWHEPETHLIPRILKAALKDEPLEIYGSDYPTPDGTAVRDYVHVSDLAQAHGAAMTRLFESTAAPETGCFEAFNLGSENGYSVLEVVQACERALGRKIRRIMQPRREGDVPRLVADSSRARAVLGFVPSAGALDEIFATAWKWEQTLAQGLGGKRIGKKAVFLDRDGTINIDPGYISDPAQMSLIAGAGAALAELKRAGFALIVVTNQSGIGRGIIRPEVLPKIHARMDELLEADGVHIDHYEYCVHRPEAGCECRKPKAKLLLDGAQALGIDVSQSFMVGDKASDILAGRNAGCRATILVRTGHGEATEKDVTSGEPHHVADSLTEAVKWILSHQ